ncbi:MAG: alpha/beta hydrolase family protein, partial [bacterium]
MHLNYFPSVLLDSMSYLWMGLQKSAEVTPSPPEAIDDYIRRNRVKDFGRFFCDPDEVPKVRITRTTKRLNYVIQQFHFTSYIVTGHDRNDVVYGHFYKKRGKSDLPVVILLHGWRMGDYIVFERFRRLFMHKGWNSVIVDLPYHMNRTPAASFSGEYMFTSHSLRTLEALRQSVIDVRSVVNWLKERGVERVGVFGVSFGALLSGILACVDEDIDFSILVAPPAEFTTVFNRSRLGGIFKKTSPRMKELMKRYHSALDAVSLPRHKPLLPPERILIIEALYDLMVPTEVVERL